jgi:hypothetical protein
MRKLGEAEFPHLESLAMRGEALESDILQLCREDPHPLPLDFLFYLILVDQSEKVVLRSQTGNDGEN